MDLFLALAVLIQLQCPGDVALFFADGACTAEQLIFPHPIADRLHPQLHAVDDGGPQGVTAVFEAEQVAHLGSLGQQAVHIAPPVISSACWMVKCSNSESCIIISRISSGHSL